MLDNDLALTRQAAKGEAARVNLFNHVLGNARRRTALAKRILRNAAAEHRDLYARFFGTDYNHPNGWDLLICIAGRG